MLQLQRVYSRFAFEVVVGDDKGFLRLGGNGVNARLPSLQFGAGIEIVVAVVARVAVEPLIVIASVQAHISKRGGHVFAGSNRLSQSRLVDIAEGHSLLGEVAQGPSLVQL